MMQKYNWSESSMTPMHRGDYYDTSDADEEIKDLQKRIDELEETNADIQKECDELAEEVQLLKNGLTEIEQVLTQITY